jgi:hypothetical protein
MQSKDLQHETLRIYQSLIDLREDWSGSLVLCCGSGCAHTGAPAAVSIAGGTTLAIDSDAAAMKSAMRAGYLDFVVNTLDEALRTLKNEIRQKRPLSVGVITDVETALAEMVERGLQPEMQFVHSPNVQRMLSNAQVEALRARGMRQTILSVGDDPERPPLVPYRPFLILYRKPHYEYFFAAPEASVLREIDTALLAALPAGDTVRLRWLDRIPKYLREARSRGRWTWLNDAELEFLANQGFTPESQP